MDKVELRDVTARFTLWRADVVEEPRLHFDRCHHTCALLAFYDVDLPLALSTATLSRTGEVAIHFRVLAFTLALTLIAGALYRLAPARQATRMSLNEELKGSGSGASGGKRQNRARSLLVASEIALSVVLLARLSASRPA